MHTCGEVHPAHGKFLEESAPMPLSRETTSTARLMCELRPLDLVLSLLGPHKARIDDQGSLRYRRTRRPLARRWIHSIRVVQFKLEPEKVSALPFISFLLSRGIRAMPLSPDSAIQGACHAYGIIWPQTVQRYLNSDKAFLTHERGRPAERCA